MLGRCEGKKFIKLVTVNYFPHDCVSKARLNLLLLFTLRVLSRVAESEPEPEVFGWSRSRIPNNTGSRSRIFLSESGCSIGSFFTSHS